MNKIPCKHRLSALVLMAACQWLFLASFAPEAQAHPNRGVKRTRSTRHLAGRVRGGVRRRMRTCAAPLLAPESGIRASRPQVIAHRGASGEAPENTLSSVKLAWQKDADAVEIDVYLSRDGKIVVYHDKTTKRIGGRDVPVQEQTLAELRQLDVGAWKDPSYAGERIPTLEEVLATVPRSKRLFIEVKSGPEIVPVLIQTLRSWKQTATSAVVIAFSYEVAERVKQSLPHVPVYWLVGFKQDDRSGEWEPSLDAVISRAQKAGFEGINVNDTPLLDEAFVRRVHGAGLSLFVWTVNDKSRARELASMGVDGITTDRPAWVLETVQQE